MEFKGLIKGRILKRYKRFLADIELESGEIIVAHTANTGSMTTCWEPGWDVLVSYHDDPKRKLKYSLQMTHNGDSFIGVNTSITNKLVHEALEKGVISELSEFDSIRPEVKVGKSRIDFKITNKNIETYIEVKNVTLKSSESKCSFPDSVTTRGQKHLKELMDLMDENTRAVMLYIVQREDVSSFHPAEEIDPIYSKLLKEAHSKGVTILVYQCSLSPDKIEITAPLKWTL